MAKTVNIRQPRVLMRVKRVSPKGMNEKDGLGVLNSSQMTYRNEQTETCCRERSVREALSDSIERKLPASERKGRCRILAGPMILAGP